MMRSLRLKLIGAVAVALVIVLVAVLGLLNLLTYRELENDIFGTLRLIAASGGNLRGEPPQESVPELLYTQETPFQLRYCSVILDADNQTVLRLDMSHIAALSREHALEYARVIAGREQSRGLFARGRMAYAYLRLPQEPGSILVILMDCTFQMAAARSITQRSILLGLVCLLVFIIIVYALSKKIIRPVIANMEGQKQFITNAGHELKTPLAIIAANTEFLEMTTGENEWTASIRKQVERLTVLVNKLIRLARMTERNEAVLTEVDFSQVASDAVAAFRPLAEQQQKKLADAVRPGVRVQATADGLPELVNILLDNAVKYCDEHGEIQLALEPRKGEKGAVLRVSNTYRDGAKLDYGRFFDRFYRQDTSHSSEKAGYGIGLSMAQSLADEFRGRISVEYRHNTICFTVTLP